MNTTIYFHLPILVTNNNLMLAEYSINLDRTHFSILFQGEFIIIELLQIRINSELHIKEHEGSITL